MKKINPFKMFGPWIGLFIGLVISLIFRIQSPILDLPRIFQCNTDIPGGCWTSSIYTNLIYLAILGFILGWIINILFKKDNLYKHNP